MSQTKIDNITRSSLLKSYNNCCFYCSKPLVWDELHIDHIIPESIIIDNSIRSEYCLDAEFDVNDLINLVPVHTSCNLRKGNSLFPKQTLLYYYSITKKRKLLIQKNIEALRKQKNRGSILSKLSSALENNLISPKELDIIIENAKENEWNSKKIVLPKGVEFIDEVYDIFYFNKDCSELYNKTMTYEVELVNNENSKKQISTLKEWSDLIKQGYYPLTNADTKMSSYYSFLEELIDVIHNAKMPKISFISDPWIDLDEFDYLSPNIINMLDVENTLDIYIKENLSIGDLLRQGIITKCRNDNFKIALKYKDSIILLSEQFRADLNNDGVEDIFVKGYTYCINGTLGFGFTAILTRYSNKHLIERIV